MNPTFSIIIPVYNVAPYLRECLDSVLAQTYTAWEAICVDDGSIDGSSEILDEYAKEDQRFRVVHQQNAGVSVARNRGLDIVTGEWIIFLDADDLWRIGLLENLSILANRFPKGYLFRFGFASFSNGTDIDSLLNETTFPAQQKVIDISHHILYDDFFAYFWQFAFKREIVKDVKFPSYIRGEDRVFLMQILCFKANSFVATDEVCYFYRQHQGSAVHSRASVQMLKDELSHRLDVIEAIDKCGKRMPYRRTEWLEGYCLRSYLELAEQSGEYSSEEQKELIGWFYHELPRICRAKGYSNTGKYQARLYRILRCKIGRHFCCRKFQSICHKLYLLTHPLALSRSIQRRVSHAKN